MRYALIEASIHSLAGNIPPELLVALVENRVWTPAAALAHARQMPDEGQRARALTDLAPRLPEDLREQALREALAAARKIQRESARAQALAGLALRPAELGHHKEALTTAREIQNESARAQALAGLALRLAELGHYEKALAAAREIRDEGTRADPLRVLAKNLAGPSHFPGFTPSGPRPCPSWPAAAAGFAQRPARPGARSSTPWARSPAAAETFARHPARCPLVAVSGRPRYGARMTEYAARNTEGRMPNPFIPYLNRYTTASPDHEAAFDEFIGQTPPPGGAPLRLETRTERFVRACFARPRPPSVILTGNAGDGKTYLCRQIVAAFTGQPVMDWADRLDWPIARDGLTLRVVKDLSEMSEEAGASVLRDLVANWRAEEPREVFLIAANEGRLRAVLQRERLVELYQEMDRQLREGPALENDRLIVLNLNQVTTSTYVPAALEWLTDPARWEPCAACAAWANCPIYFNARRLADAHVAGRVQRLYQVLEHLGVHVTIRDMLIHPGLHGHRRSWIVRPSSVIRCWTGRRTATSTTRTSGARPPTSTFAARRWSSATCAASTWGRARSLRWTISSSTARPADPACAGRARAALCARAGPGRAALRAGPPGVSLRRGRRAQTGGGTSADALAAPLPPQTLF